jgi:uncharacterized protein
MRNFAMAMVQRRALPALFGLLVACHGGSETSADATGSPGTGGQIPSSGGSAGSGASAGATASSGGGTGGALVAGGTSGHTGGRAGVSGGADVSGGAPATGGLAGSGGQSSSAAGGGVPVGGQNATGGALSTGGLGVTGGVGGAGGRASTGGAAGGTASGGRSSTGGTSGTSGPAELVDAIHVRLLPGSPFYDRQELHRTGYLASFDPNKLLFEFRSLAKLPQAGGATAGYAGWDTSFLKGHMTGHFLSAASRMAAATGDSSFATKVDTMVTELAKCQAALGNGYLSAFPSTVFDWVEGKAADGGGIVVPYYTIHKIMAGLLDAYHYVGNQQALEVASKMADYFQTRLAALSADQIEKMFRTDGSKNPQNEFGAMSDVLSELSVDTGQEKYLETAKIFNRSWFMTPLAAGEDRLQGLHGNTHVAQALGIAHTANLSGDTTSLQASENFWKIVTGQHSFVIGGNTFHEWLDKAGVEAGPSIDSSQALPATTAETCNSHNMLKLTNVLFARTPRIEYVDYYERTLYNHILASVAPDTGQVTYFTPMHGHFRTYLNGTFCCTGSGIENTPRYNEGIYFQTGSSLWVNLYIPSEMTWEQTGLTIRQEGHAAVGEPVTLTIVEGSAATEATLNLRIPFWVSAEPTLTVNGSPVEPSPQASTYVPISRAWNVGDVVTLTLPTSLRLEHAKDVSSMVSVFYGPVLLAGELGSANMPNDFADKDAYLTTAPATVPEIENASADPADWLEPVAGTPMAFTAHDAGAATGITFRPLYEVHHQRYSVYWSM